MTAASKSQLEMNAAAVLAGFSRPANDNLRQMFGEMEITFPMKLMSVLESTIERSLPRPYPTNFNSSRIDKLVGLYDQQPAQRTFKMIPHPAKSLDRERWLRFNNFSSLSPKSLTSLTDSVQRSRRRHAEIIAACFNDLTTQRARQELIKQKRRNAMFSLELIRMKQQQMRR